MAGGGALLRLDPDELLRRVVDAGGPDLTFDGWCAGGEQGAAYVRWSDGHRSVFHWAPGFEPEGRATRALAMEVREAARRGGVPAPRQEVLLDLGDGLASVQELVVGRPGGPVTEAMLDQLLALLDRRRGVFAGDPRAADGIALRLVDDGPGFAMHGPMRAAGGRAARLLDWVEEVGRSTASPMLSGPDAVHFDHHPGNVLLDDAGRVTALIDWDGAVVGNADFDLVTLRFGIRGYPFDPEIEDRLAHLVAALPDDVRRPAWAHMSLRLVDWSLRFHPADIDRWLDLAETGVD